MLKKLKENAAPILLLALTIIYWNVNSRLMILEQGFDAALAATMQQGGAILGTNPD